MRIYLLSLLFIHPLFGTDVGASPLTLKDSLQYALIHSPELSADKLKFENAQRTENSKLAVMLPQLDVAAQAGAGFTRPTQTETEPWLSQLSLTLKENLYDNGESYTRYRQAQAELDLEKLVLQRQTQKLFLEVVQTFHDYSKLQHLHAARTEQRLLYEKQNLRSTKQYQGGLKTKKDFLRFKAQAQRATIEERSARNQLKKAKFTLCRLMGIPESSSVEFKTLEVNELQTEMPVSPPLVDATLDGRIIDSTRRIQQYSVRIAERNNLPKVGLSLSGQYGYNQFLRSGSSFDSSKNFGAQALLSLSYNILDWGIRKNEIDSARAQEQIVGHNADKSRLELITEIESLSLDLTDLKANQMLTEELLANQQKSYELLFREYQEGQVPYVDLNNSLQELMDSKVLYLNAHYQLSSTLTKHDYYQGKLNASYLQK